MRQRCVSFVIVSCLSDTQLECTLFILLQYLFDYNVQSADGKHVEIVSPPADAPVGERVFIDGFSGEPFSSTQVKKKKTWDIVAKNLKTIEGGVATWDGKEIKTSAGVCSAASLVGAPIS